MKKKVFEAIIEIPDGMSIVALLRELERAGIAAAVEMIPPAKPTPRGSYPGMYCYLTDATAEYIVITVCVEGDDEFKRRWFKMPWTGAGGAVSVGPVEEVEPDEQPVTFRTKTIEPEEPEDDELDMDEAISRTAAGTLDIDAAKAVLEKHSGKHPKAALLGVTICQRIAESQQKA